MSLTLVAAFAAIHAPTPIALVVGIAHAQPHARVHARASVLAHKDALPQLYTLAIAV